MTSILAGEAGRERGDGEKGKEIFGAEFLASQPFSSGFPSMVKVLVA